MNKYFETFELITSQNMQTQQSCFGFRVSDDMPNCRSPNCRTCFGLPTSAGQTSLTADDRSSFFSYMIVGKNQCVILDTKMCIYTNLFEKRCVYNYISFAIWKPRFVIIHTLYTKYTPQVCTITHHWVCKITYLCITHLVLNKYVLFYTPFTQKHTFSEDIFKTGNGESGYRGIRESC